MMRRVLVCALALSGPIGCAAPPAPAPPPVQAGAAVRVPATTSTPSAAPIITPTAPARAPASAPVLPADADPALSAPLREQLRAQGIYRTRTGRIKPLPGAAGRSVPPRPVLGGTGELRVGSDTAAPAEFAKDWQTSPPVVDLGTR